MHNTIETPSANNYRSTLDDRRRHGRGPCRPRTRPQQAINMEIVETRGGSRVLIGSGFGGEYVA